MYSAGLELTFSLHFQLSADILNPKCSFLDYVNHSYVTVHFWSQQHPHLGGSGWAPWFGLGFTLASCGSSFSLLLHILEPEAAEETEGSGRHSVPGESESGILSCCWWYTVGLSAPSGSSFLPERQDPFPDLP